MRQRAVLFLMLALSAVAILPAPVRAQNALVPNAAAPLTAPSDPDACGNLKPEEVYARLKKETFSHNGYVATYYHSTERGKRHEIFARGELTGKYLQKPAMFCERRLSSSTSFPEQAGVGEQECYSAQDDLTRILLPGAYRALGVVTMFPEDPQASYLNGENNNNIMVWNWFKTWDKMLDNGQLGARCATIKGKPAWVAIIRARKPDPLYNHIEMRIWIDPQTWFPVRLEKFVPNDPKPVVIYQFEDLKLDDKLSAQDIGFEGLAPKWSLVSSSGGPKLAGLMQEEPKFQELPDPDQADFKAMFVDKLDQALAEMKDYSTELTLELRFHRLRQFRQDRYSFIARNKSFAALTRHIEANYMQINTGENFRTVFDPTKDNLLHVLPAGVYRFMGEQTFPLDDPRLFSVLGDNIADLNFFAIRDEFKRWLSDTVQARSGVFAYGDLKGPFVELTRKSQGIPAQPTIMRLMLDEKTGLPARLEYRGYDDPKGYLTIRFSDTRVNAGIKSAELWK